MSAINFVVRDVAGNISRGSVAGDGAPSSLLVGSGGDVSLNLTQGQILSYTRSGQSLEITLVDGRVIVVDGFFGSAESQLFLSSGGYLTEVELNQGAGADYYANYIADDGVGKFALNDDLYFMREADVLLADANVSDGEVGQLAALAAPLFGWGGAAAAAGAVGAATLVAAGDGGEGGEDAVPAPEVEVTAGTTESNEHVVNEVDHADGVEVGGVGTAGAEVAVTIDGVTETTTVAEDGTWEVVFDADDVAEGEYTTDVTVTITNEGGATTVTDTLVVDTVIGVELDAVGGDDGVINASEFEGGVTLTGAVTGGDSVVVTIDGVEYDAVVSGGSWALDVATSVLGEGEYDADIVVTATDAAGNSSSTAGVITVDTITSVTVETATVGGSDSVVNGVEQAGGVTLTGTAQPGASVAVTFGAVTQTVVAGTDGTWSTTYAAGDVPTGELDVPVSVVATDVAGNTASASSTVTIDTLVNELELVTNTAGGADGVVNFAEKGGGFTATGTVEPGSTVIVELEGVALPATVDANGNWTVNIPAGTLPDGEYDASLVVTATDAAGNTASTSSTIPVDTLVNNLELVTNSAGGADGVVNFDENSGAITATGTVEPGSTVIVELEGVAVPATVDANGNWTVTYPAGTLPGGEYDASLVVTATDAAGNTASTSSTVPVDTFVNDLQLSSNSAGGSDGVVNFNELGEAITMSGTVEPGSTVNVNLHGVSVPATVDANGNWTVTYPAGTLPGGEFETSVIVTATDAAGNTSSLTEAVTVDTVAGDLALSSEPIEIDDVVNAVEHADGVIISGTATAGLTVTVGLGDATLNVVAGNDGTWSVNFPAGSVPEGTYEAPITASITDAAGNFKEVSDTVQIDTEVVPFAFSSAPIEGDDVINGAEAADGVVLSGTVEAGSTVVVEFGGQSITTSAGSNGTWSVSFPASAIADGEFNATATATATDPAGNVSVITDSVQVDTLVNRLTSTDPVEGDNVVNAAEAADGVTLTGTVEAGSTVFVTFEHSQGSITREATVDGAGNWSVSYAGSEIPGGEYDANITIAATDAFGNTDSITDTFKVDTVVTDAPGVEFVTIGGDEVRSIEVGDTDGDLSVSEITASGQSSEIAEQSDAIDLGPSDLFTFSPLVPDGSHLVVTDTDDAGNSNSTYVVLEESGTDAVDLSGLDGFEIGAIDLSFARDSELTIDLSTVEGLSDNDNNLIIHGGDDDSVNLAGAINSGTSTTLDGTTFDIYTIGDDAQIFVEEGINVTN